MENGCLAWLSTKDSDGKQELPSSWHSEQEALLGAYKQAATFPAKDAADLNASSEEWAKITDHHVISGKKAILLAQEILRVAWVGSMYTANIITCLTFIYTLPQVSAGNCCWRQDRAGEGSCDLPLLTAKYHHKKSSINYIRFKQCY